MNKNAKFHWNIYDNLLSEFRYSVCGKYFFKNLNVNWMLECAPNGQSREDEGNVSVLLSLLRLPNKIKAVLIHMVLNCNYNDNDTGVNWDFKLLFDYEHNQSYGWPEYSMLSSYLFTTESITFSAQVTVLEIYDQNNDKIAPSKWSEYGIIDHEEFDLEVKQKGETESGHESESELKLEQTTGQGNRSKMTLCMK
eukprot:UN12681